MPKPALAGFNPVTHMILEMETTPPKFSDIEKNKLTRIIAPVNRAMDALLEKAVGPEKNEKALFLIYQLKRLLPN